MVNIAKLQHHKSILVKKDTYQILVDSRIFPSESLNDVILRMIGKKPSYQKRGTPKGSQARPSSKAVEAIMETNRKQILKVLKKAAKAQAKQNVK